MIFYDFIKIIHVSTIVLSIIGFITRIIIKLNNGPYQDTYAIKKLPHKIDTILLASAITMVYLLGINPFTTLWLTVKIIGLLCYIFLGLIALRWAKTKKMSFIAAFFAIMVFAYIVFVAHFKTPII